MTPPPVPPHEREWRHPSELPAPPHEPATPGGRLLILATAAIGLALVGVMAIRMTPGRTTHRDALVTVSTASAFPTVSADSFGDLVGAASNSGRRFTDLLGRTLSSFFSSTERSQISASTIVRSSGETPGVDRAEFAVVTPMGTDGLGVTTAAALAGRSGTIEAMLPSGAIVTAELVGTDNGVAVVRLATADATAATPVAEANDDNDWTVIAFGDEFEVSDDGNSLQALAVPEAAPIFNASGELIGLCTIGPDGVEMLPVASLPDIAPPLPPTESTESSESTVVEDSAVAAVDTEPVDSSVPTVSTEPAEPPVTSAATLPASTDVATTDGAVGATSEPVDSSAPATTATP